MDENRWYGTEGQGVIRRVWELGLMNGMGNGTFLPEGPLRICEAVKLAAVIRSRALDDGAEFPSAQPWYQPYVNYAVAEGILQRGEFADRMEEAVTRGELAHILAAALPESELPHINAIFAIPDVISLDTEPAGYWQDILTLYRAGGVKTIDGYRSYVTVNGGMTDNPRYALYQSPYTVLPAGRMKEQADFVCTLAGRCCESGDLIQENITLPRPERDDLIAVLTTGAYNFSMASNYNRLCRPALIMIRDGEARLAVRRQTFEDLTACDL